MCNVTRREFIKTATGATVAACCASAWGPKVPFAYAASTIGRGRTLVCFNQFGGADHLNTFTVPYGLSAYYDRRPTIAIPANQVLTLDSTIGFNPALTSLHNLYRDGDVAVIQGTGDPIGSRSHFSSQEIMSRGVVNRSAGIDNKGWIGRLGDLDFVDLPFNTFGIGVGQLKDFSSSRGKNRPIVTNRLRDYGLDNDWVSNNENLQRRELVQKLLSRQKNATERQEAQRIAHRQMYSSLATIGGVYNSRSTAIAYQNNGPGRFFNDAMTLIESSQTGTQVIYGGLGGWDTHSDILETHTALLGQFNSAIDAFSRDCKRAGKWNDVAVVVFTEFGRNTFENKSGGLDHGVGSAMLVIGGGVHGGIFGGHPSNNEILNSPWSNMDIDFRNVLSKAINWLGFDSGPVFPESFSKVNVNFI